MRVSRICVPSQPTNYYYLNSRPKIDNQQKNIAHEQTPPFKGKFGAILSGVFGAAAVVVTAIVAAPAAICLTGGGAIIGAIGGHAAEDAVNGESNN